MAQRSVWTGKLWVSALFSVDVKMYKASGEYAEADQFKEVCECHQQPFGRKQVCVGGRRRLTEAMTKAGDTADSTRLVKAVERGGKYFVVPDEQIKQINEAVASKSLRAEYRVPLADAPLEQITESYYVAADAGSEPGVNAIHQGLEQTGEALVGTWVARSKPRIALIHPVGDVLMLSTVRYAAEWTSPTAEATAHLQAQISQAELNGAVQMIGLLDTKPNWDAFESDAVKLRKKVVTAVLAGKPVAKQADPAAAPVAAGGLMDQINAALAAGAKPKAKPGAKRKAAPAPRGTRKVKR